MKYKFSKGYTPWNKGKTIKNEPRLLKCRYWLGKKNTNGFKKGQSAWNKGVAWSQEIKDKVSQAKKGKPSTFKGRKHTAKARKIIGEKAKGRTAWNKGTKGIMKPNSGSFTSEKMSGEKHPSWKGGVSRFPYAHTFTKKLKSKVKQRDNFTCILCQEKTDIVVHHIDYDKMNCDIGNLITLCRKCNSIVNFKRKYRKQYIQSLLQNKKNGVKSGNIQNGQLRAKPI